MAAQRWTAKVFVNSNVGEIDAEVYASTLPGAKQQIRAKYGDYQQIYNLNQVDSPRSGGGSSSGGSGCLALVGLAFLIIVGGLAGGGDDDSYTPPESTQDAPMERVEYAPAPTTPSYANPPGPCVTANFEPC